MKKLFLLFCFVFMSLLLKAQTDYVVSYDNVVVHTTADMNGPVAGTLKKNDMVKVLTTSGEWAIIDYNGHAAYVLKYFLKEVHTDKSTNNSNSNGNVAQQTESNTPSSNELMTRNGDIYQCGGVSYTGTELYSFLKTNCPDAYDYYLSANRLKFNGISFFIAGAVFHFALGYPLYFLAPTYGCFLAGAAFLGAGAGFLTASVPMWIVGAYRIKHTPEVYNSYCVKSSAYFDSRTPKVGIQFQSSTDGVGFAVTF